jgi:DNA invertase Pin-like site-specific DNA recombinase
MTENKLTYDEWKVRIAGWGMVEPQALSYYKKRRLPISEELKEKRRKHMIDLNTKGYPKTWIARLYGITRMQVTRIINNLPNN